MKWIFLLIASLSWQNDKVIRSDTEWKEMLGPLRYEVMRKKGTQDAFLGAYVYTVTAGVYHCAACDLALFHAQDKYDAGTGWPNFTKPVSPKNVYYLEDWTFGFKRYEVLCSRCDSHLGHVFKDGPPKKYLRYTVNSIAMSLKK